MADRYICPVDSAGYRDAEGFVQHAVACHGHRIDIEDCDCAACVATFPPTGERFPETEEIYRDR